MAFIIIIKAIEKNFPHGLTTPFPIPDKVILAASKVKLILSINFFGTIFTSAPVSRLNKILYLTEA